MLSRVEQRTNGQPLDAMERKQKVRWTETEERLIAESLANQITARPFRRNFSKAIKVAQEQLTKEGKLAANRHRDIQSQSMIPEIIDHVASILKARRENAKQVDWARNTLKQQNQKQASKEDILDQLTDEEVEVYFRDRVLANISPAELLGSHVPHGRTDGAANNRDGTGRESRGQAGAGERVEGHQAVGADRGC
jgi:hypothetical protein